MSDPSIHHVPASGADVLLFDLGGVLVGWNGIEALLDCSQRRLTREDARRFWLESPSVRSFEVGRCSPRAFAEGVVRELHLPLEPDEFLREFLTWDRGPFPGACALLEELKGCRELACLSNNNELHWKRLCDEFGLGKYFHHCFLSHEIGLLKPDREAFQFVLRRLGRAPSQIVFFDDNPECVHAAASLGIRALQVRGLAELRQALAGLGLLGEKPRQSG